MKKNKLSKYWFALFCDKVDLANFVSVVLDLIYQDEVTYNE